MAALTSGEQMRQAIASTLGAAPVVARSDAALADAVAPLHALVVLDNCEHLVDVLAPLLDTMLAHPPGPRWLATSQESLKCSGEQVYRLGGLTVPEALDLDAAAESGAVALFIERAHALDPRFRLGADNLAPVVEICRRLDGIPLAIEFAAARVPLLGVRGVAERLDQRLDLLSGGSRMKLRRHQTLRAALEWSYGLLSDDEKRVFRCLGAFTGGFTLELAQSLAQDDRTDEWQVLDLLSRLIDRSLVIAEGDDRPRYSLLETTRAFALEMLAENGESPTVLRRHAEVMRDFAHALESAMRRGEVPPHASARELGNLRAAMNWSSADPASTPLACELHAAAWPLFQRTGCNAEFTTRMLALWPLPAGLPRELEAASAFALGRLSPMLGADACWEAAQRAVVLYRDLGDVERLADALTQLSVFAHHRQQPETAREALTEAERLTGDSASYYMQCRLAYARGLRAGAAGDRGAQLASFAELAELGRSRGDAFNELVGLGNIGSVELDSGELDAAVAMLTRVVARFRELQLPNSMGCALSELSLALALRGDDVDVLGMAREAHAKARLAGVESSNAALLAAAVHHLDRGDAPRAALLVGRAEAALSGVPARPRPFEMSLVPQLLDRCRGLLPAAHLERARQRGAGFSDRRAAGIAFDAAPVEAVAA
jgi:predicted ATPase